MTAQRNAYRLGACPHGIYRDTRCFNCDPPPPVAFGRQIFPCGHIDDWSGTKPARHDCELERRLTAIEQRLAILDAERLNP